MGSYYDTVYCLQNGDFIKKFDGAYEVDDNTVYFDESDYKYKIGGATVSKSEYDRQKTRFSTIITQQASTRRL